MEESELQVIDAELFRKFFGKNHQEKLEKTAFDNSRKQLQSLAKSGKVHEILSACIHDYSTNVNDLELTDILIESVIQKAKECLKQSEKLTINHFLCKICSGIIRDPVTLKCGHTFSKECILAHNTDSFFCEKCGMSHSCKYIAELKNNVVISKFIETVCEHQTSETAKYEQDEPVICDEKIDLKKDADKKNVETDNYPLLLQSTFHEDYYRSKGDMLLTSGKLEDAFIAYLLSLSLGVSKVMKTKENISQVFHRLLMKYDCKVCKRRNSLTQSNDSYNADSNEFFCDTNVCHSSNDKSNCLCEDWNQSRWIACSKSESLHNVLKVFFKDLERVTNENNKIGIIDASLFEKRDFECTLCIRTLWEPVTTPCGHTFCRMCLNRSLDHQVYCPLCKTSLSMFLAKRIQNTTVFIELAIKTLFPDDYLERKAIHTEEMEEFVNAGIDSEHAIPLFICTIAFPTVPCPLHIFEPRYRLMIRQCMESGSKQFGMCAYINDRITEYGTLLEIRGVKYFPDGRSMVDAVGSKRFRVLKTGQRDGYHTAFVEFLKDETVNANIESIRENHNLVYKICNSWFMDLPIKAKTDIVDHFGPMPPMEANFFNNPNGPSWFWWSLAVLPLDIKLQLTILSMTCVPQRLHTLHRILMRLQ